MKKLILSILLLSTILASSCSKEETLPIDNFAMGQVVSSRSVVGTNQKAMFGCELSVSEHATNVEIKWEDASGITYSQELYEKGISYRTFVWNTPGDYTVKCKVTYLYGSEVKIIEKSYTATVYKTDFRNSLFGDDLKTVLIDNPGLVKEDGWILIESDTHYHYFEMDNGTLTRGDSYELKTNKGTPSLKAGYSFFMLEVKKYEKIAVYEVQYKLKLGSSAQEEVEFTEEQERVFNKYLEGEILEDSERITLGEFLDKGLIELEAQLWVVGWDGTYYKISVCCSIGKIPNTYELRSVFGLRPIG